MILCKIAPVMKKSIKQTKETKMTYTFDELHKFATLKGWHLNMATSHKGLIYWLDWKDEDGDWRETEFKSIKSLTSFIKGVA
tara:strand:- start:18599 stop:18844 length:246 start_codon:yes stop_codon:yes gene_type:complete